MKRRIQHQSPRPAEPAAVQWLRRAGFVQQSVDQIGPSMMRLADRMEREGMTVPRGPWEGTALETNLMILHTYEVRVGRKDLTSAERRHATNEAHRMRELIARLGGLPQRGIKG